MYLFQIVAHLEELAASNPDLETEVIGQSWEGKASRVLLRSYYITVDLAKAASRTSHAVTLTGLSFLANYSNYDFYFDYNIY
jgi:hypothetical protein